MRYYLSNNVYQESLERIRYLFDEFEVVMVSSSGGKDSTVILNLALQVAEEKGKLPVPLLFIDQEAEWQATIDYTKIIMSDPRVIPYWLQIPIKLFNSSSFETQWLQCWQPGHDWIRDKEEISYKENVYGTDRFKEMFTAFIKHEFPEQTVANLGGVRAEESPSRRIGLTNYITYKDITWGRINSKTRGHFTFYPIYDWSYSDVWKFIHDNQLPYNKMYDHQYNYGIPIHEMRVSNLHHETAIRNLYYMQEVEPVTWNRIVKRLPGINTAGMLGSKFEIDGLPYMFASWREYRDHLLNTLIVSAEDRATFQKYFDKMEKDFDNNEYDCPLERLHRVHVVAIIHNDLYATKLQNFYNGHHLSKKTRERLGIE
jgi:predicted phosphoadenosine phosphosulfate sulfurtransferase